MVKCFVGENSDYGDGQEAKNKIDFFFETNLKNSSHSTRQGRVTAAQIDAY